MTEIELKVQGPFNLTASAQFLEGFAPAARPDAAREPGSLCLAFPAAPSWRPVGLRLRQDGDSVVLAEAHGDTDDREAVTAHAARIVSLDIDGSGFAEVGAADPEVGRLQRRYPGLRPVLFHSPYEAACWAVIGHRIRITQAAAIKQRLAEQLGEEVRIGEISLHSFPAPAVLLGQENLPGLPLVKVERLRGLAKAALDGDLEADRLRGMETAAALTELQRLPGIGPFSAELILVRGAGHPDVFPNAERRLHEEMARAYGLTDPSLTQLAAIARRWRPFRSWAAVLFRTAREEDTGEIATGRRSRANARGR